MFFAKSNIGHKICRPDDVVINTLWAWMGALGVTKHGGIVSPAYGVYRPLAATEILPRYADFLLRTPLYAAEYQRRSTGVNSSRMRLYPDQFLRVPIALPPLSEQVAIVEFLNWASNRLEKAIRAKRQELALIREMISNITDSALQSEGTASLRLSTVSEMVSRPINRCASQSYTRIGLYNRGRGIFHKMSVEGEDLGDSDFFWIENGDFVISGQFAWEGAVALARADDTGCVASHRYPILRGCNHHVSSAFLFSLFRTSYGLMLLDHYSRGAAGRNRPLNIARLLKENIPVPPISAQVRITELLDREYAVSQSFAHTIQFVNEYRTRLVADVVTGKLDVREAAAKLPVEEQTIEPEELVEDDSEMMDDEIAEPVG